MADISSDQALNGLKIKTDALPNDWYVTLVNPKTGEPGENMTIARFIELFTPKQPDATITNKGVLSTEIYKNITSRHTAYRSPNGVFKAFKIKTKLKAGRYGGYYFYCRIGQSTNTLYNQIVHLNLKVYEYKFANTAKISLGDNVIEDIVICAENDDSITVYVNCKMTVNLTGGAIDLLFRNYDESNAIESIEGLTEKYIPGSHSNEIITTISNPSSYSLTPNALTETVVEEVPVSATPMTLEETGQPVPMTQTVERYEYSVPKMAEAILALQKEIAELKGGAGKE